MSIWAKAEQEYDQMQRRLHREAKEKESSEKARREEEEKIYQKAYSEFLDYHFFKIGRSPFPATWYSMGYELGKPRKGVSDWGHFRTWASEQGFAMRAPNEGRFNGVREVPDAGWYRIAFVPQLDDAMRKHIDELIKAGEAYRRAGYTLANLMEVFPYHFIENSSRYTLKYIHVRSFTRMQSISFFPFFLITPFFSDQKRTRDMMNALKAQFCVMGHKDCPYKFE